ncbi:MAG TPA: polyprenyl synthetase family protein [Streptosporangiaceae bacterium]|nr:polyprenyl synthetase family protein [Streptosporangiaceae bacterium]
MVSTVPVDFPDGALEASVVDDLGRVEALLLEVGHPDDELLTTASRHLVKAGGKRFRAMLVLLAAQFGDPADERVIQAAVAIELTHLATLFHDDVMDEAFVRRGSESVNARWGNSVAILAGDFLFAQASLILASLGPDAVRIQAETFNRLVTGQLAETVGPRPGQDPLDHYMYVISEKTGSLIATAGLFGAMYSGANAAAAARIARACELIGVAWQLSDDVIDVASDSAQSGKTPGTDLRQGVPTLPVLYALRSADPADARLRLLLDGSVDLADDDDLVAEALRLLRAHQGMAEARADVLSWVNAARTEIMALPDVPARAAFLAMCDFVVKRTGLGRGAPAASRSPVSAPRRVSLRSAPAASRSGRVSLPPRLAPAGSPHLASPYISGYV